jgi:hypothetical protein
VVAAFASQGRWLAKPCHKAQAIRSGLHLNWLVWAARIYFSQFRATWVRRCISTIEPSNGSSVESRSVANFRRAPEVIMRANLMPMVLMGSCTTFAFAQTPGQSHNRDQVLQQQSRQLLQPSPGEIMRCNQPRELLNASSRDACRAIGRWHLASLRRSMRASDAVLA